MVKFIVFDDFFDILVVLVVFFYEGLFRFGVIKLVKDVNFNVCMEWVYLDFIKWINKYYIDCFRFLKDLVFYILVEFFDWMDNMWIL